MLIDIHCHHVKNISPTAVLTLDTDTKIPEHQYFSFGIHPWLAQTVNLSDVTTSLLKYIHHPNFLMLGEIGLDRSSAVDFKSQIDLFTAQVKFAKSNKVNTLLIHCVRALSDILKVINETNYQGLLVFHDTNFSSQDLKLVTELGHYVSFGDNLFRACSKATKYLTQVDQSKLLLESGDGKQTITQVYEKAAALLELEVESLERTVLKNFQSLFNDRNFSFSFN